MLLVFVQQRVASSAALVLQRRGVVVLGIDVDPVVDTLSSHAQHTGDVGGGTAVVVLKDGQGAPKEAGIPGLRELTPEALPLPGGQVEPAHALLLYTLKLPMSKWRVKLFLRTCLGELEPLGLAWRDPERLRLTAAGIERSDTLGPWLYSEAVRALMGEYAWR